MFGKKNTKNSGLEGSTPVEIIFLILNVLAYVGFKSSQLPYPPAHEIPFSIGTFAIMTLQ